MYGNKFICNEIILLIIDDDLDDFIADGVMEIDTDVTEQWKNMSYLEQKVFTAFLIIFSIFFSIVTYNTNYALIV